jgi:hypothetical protein
VSDDFFYPEYNTQQLVEILIRVWNQNDPDKSSSATLPARMRRIGRRDVCVTVLSLLMHLSVTQVKEMLENDEEL